MAVASTLRALPVRLLALAAAVYVASKRTKNPLATLKVAFGAVVAWYLYSIRARRPSKLVTPAGKFLG